MKAETGLLQVNDTNFSTEVLNSNLPVLVDFWATWCHPCRSISPLIEELAKEFAGRVKVAKLNIEENPGTPGKYRVMSIPTLILFKGGKIVDQIVGAVPKAENLKKLEAAIVALGFNKKKFYRLYEEAYKQRRAEHAEAKTLNGGQGS